MYLKDRYPTLFFYQRFTHGFRRQITFFFSFFFLSRLAVPVRGQIFARLSTRLYICLLAYFLLTCPIRVASVLLLILWTIIVSASRRRRGIFEKDSFFFVDLFRDYFFKLFNRYFTDKCKTAVVAGFSIL